MNFARSALDTLRQARRVNAASLLHMIGPAFAVNVAGTAIAFGLQVLLARLLGADEFGRYVYALTWISFCVLFAKLGLDTAALRFIPEYQAREEQGLLRGFLRGSRHAVLASSLLVAGGVAAVIILLGSRLSPELARVFLYACALLPVSAYMAMQGAQLQGFRHIVAAQAPQVILRPLLLALALIAGPLYLAPDIRADTAMLLNIGASLLAILVLAQLSRSIIPRDLSAHRPAYRTSHWGRVAVSMMFITSFTLVLNQADLIMVGSLLSTTEAGIYSAASRVATLLTFAITLVNAIAAPAIARLYAQGNIPQLQRMLNRVAWGSFLFATPLCLALMLWGEYVMYVFGVEFTAGTEALVILAAARWVIALTGSAGYLMSMSGHERQAAWILGASAALNIALNAALIPPFGIEGAAAATLVTTTLWSVLMVRYGRKLVGVNATVSLRFS
jgi:O-antigen/teichoic acid export membrane protein